MKTDHRIYSLYCFPGDWLKRNWEERNGECEHRKIFSRSFAVKGMKWGGSEGENWSQNKVQKKVKGKKQQVCTLMRIIQ